MPEIKATKIDIVPIETIKPNPRNPNKHGRDQIERLSKIIGVQGFRNPLIVSNQSGLLVVGHGRLSAAKEAGLDSIPVIFQDFASDDLEYAAMVSDNSLQLWSDLDLGQINANLKDLDGASFDIELLGLKDFTVSPDFEPGTQEDQGQLDEKKPIECPYCGKSFVKD